MLRNPRKSNKPTESPAQMLKRVQAEADAERVRMQLDDEKRAHAEKIRTERVAILSADAETAKTESAIRREKITATVIDTAPILIISGLAITGQFGSFAELLTPTFGEFLAKIVAGFMSAGLESIALFLGMHGMRALRRKDSAFWLIFGATIVAGIVACLNFDHYRSADGTPSIASYAFALFSFVAPFLWRVKIRSDHRDELVANGEIDVRGLKLPRVMWAMHPIKSFKVYRHAAWTGQRDVELAVKEWDASLAEKPVKGIAPEELDMLTAMIENLRIDVQTSEPQTIDELPPAERPKALLPASSNGYPTHHAKWSEGVALYTASLDSGTPMKVSDLATELGMTNRALAGKIKDFVTTTRKVENSVSDDGSDLTPETA